MRDFFLVVVVVVVFSPQISRRSEPGLGLFPSLLCRRKYVRHSQQGQCSRLLFVLQLIDFASHGVHNLDE